jgi:hypothetical protein
MKSTAEIEADIEATRAELVETADVLAARLGEKVQVGKRAAVRAGVAAGAAVAAVMLLRLARKKRSG